MIILAGSLFGIQLGAITTTYVQGYLVKLVMGLSMILVVLSRMAAVPIYLSVLGTIEPLLNSSINSLKIVSGNLLASALVVEAIIILFALYYGLREDIQKHEALEKA